MKIVIERLKHPLKNEVIGIMYIDDVPRFITLENRAKLIPAGTYKAKRDMHYGKPGKEDDYEVWELQDVPGRSQIQIHIGNSYKDTEGCILIGNYFSAYVYNPLIIDSKFAYNLFMFITRDEFEILVEIK